MLKITLQNLNSFLLARFQSVGYYVAPSHILSTLTIVLAVNSFSKSTMIFVNNIFNKQQDLWHFYSTKQQVRAGVIISRYHKKRFPNKDNKYFPKLAFDLNFYKGIHRTLSLIFQKRETFPQGIIREKLDIFHS